MEEEDVEMDDPIHIANGFNDFFATIASKLDNLNPWQLLIIGWAVKN